MSADNWTICPQCVKNLDDEITRLCERVKAAYGKVSRDEYHRLTQELTQKERDEITRSTLREDYEIGISQDATFAISYSASCTMCNYSFKHEYQQDVPLNENAA